VKKEDDKVVPCC